MDKMIPYYENDYYPYQMGMNELPMHDPKEGNSGRHRKMYIDGKYHKDKTQQMQELETYMHELSKDITDMIQDASPEEK